MAISSVYVVAIEIVAVVVPATLIPAPAEIVVTGATPLEAAVSLPWASTVIDAYVYAPAVTAVSAKFIVTSPDEPPPDKPVPAVTLVMSPGLGAIQASPLVVAESTERIQPLVEAAVTTIGVDAVLAEIIEPLPVRIDLSIKLDVSGATKSQEAPS